MRIAWTASAEHGPLDPDLPLLVAAAAARGVDSDVRVWNDFDVDWDGYDAVVVRSCWDYVPQRETFLAWAASVPHLHNPADVLTWTTDKTYLRLLAEQGVDVIETRWSVREGEDVGDHDEWVVKPTISAGSADTARWRTREEVWRHSEALLASGRPTMVQPYVSSVDTDGETALLFFDGTFSHAIRKGPMLSREAAVRVEPELREEITPRVPADATIDFGSRVLETAVGLLGHRPLYARVDVAHRADGSPTLMELELAEPSLFLEHGEGSADRLVAATMQRIAADRA